MQLFSFQNSVIEEVSDADVAAFSSDPDFAGKAVEATVAAVLETDQYKSCPAHRRKFRNEKCPNCEGSEFTMETRAKFVLCLANGEVEDVVAFSSVLKDFMDKQGVEDIADLEGVSEKVVIKNGIITRLE